MAPAASLCLIAGWLAATMSLWFFAFFSMPETSPGWLLQAQAACFGRTEAGLPEAYGWLVLIGSPIMLLAALFLVFRSEVTAALTDLYHSWFGKAVIMLCAATISYEAVWVGQRIKTGKQIEAVSYESTNTDSLPEHYPRTKKAAYAFELTDQHGEISGPADFRGRPVVLTFAFSHCTTVCPVLLNDLKEASRVLDNNTPMLVVSLDPWRDRSTELASFAGKWEMGPSTRFYTGNVDDVLDVIQRYNIPISRNEQNGDIYHPPMVYVLDADGNIAYSFNSPGDTWLVDAVRRLEGES